MFPLGPSAAIFLFLRSKFPINPGHSCTTGDGGRTPVCRAKLKLLAAAAGLGLVLGVAPAGAITATGVTVGSVGSDTHVGLTEDRPIGDDAVKYFIPLGDTDGTYGVGGSCGGSGFGTCSDTGNGGGKLTMILRFSPISTFGDSLLTVKFEDLDLGGANDPNGFLERLNVLKSDGATSLSGGWIYDIGDLVTGDSDTQQILNLSLGTVTDDPLYLILKFKSKSEFYGKNTAEYLIATVTGPDAPPGGQTPVPLPPALVLFVSGIVGMGALSIRRRKAKTAV